MNSMSLSLRHTWYIPPYEYLSFLAESTDINISGIQNLFLTHILQSHESWTFPSLGTLLAFIEHVMILCGVEFKNQFWIPYMDSRKVRGIVTSTWVIPAIDHPFFFLKKKNLDDEYCCWSFSLSYGWGSSCCVILCVYDGLRIRQATVSWHHFAHA